MTKETTDKQAELRTVRDTVESIWVAIVLAFVLRAFLVEAFVIPTGSMAPRLYGEHWSLQCPACQWRYAYGKTSAAAGGDRAYLPSGAICPNCTYPYAASGGKKRIDSGDRVLVLKYLYQLAKPEPWDVIVFKNPQDNHQNYIKRLIGLPGETIEIVHGDIYVAPSPEGPFEIRRKPHDVQQVMWQILHDSDFPPDPQLVSGANTRYETQFATDDEAVTAVDPPRWDAPEPARWSWDLHERRATFAGGDAPAELRFVAGSTVARARWLFLPWYGYNPRTAPSGQRGWQPDEYRDLISDLKLQTTFIADADDSQLGLVLSSFEHRFRAEVFGDGIVQLRHRQRSYSTAAGEDPWGPWEVWGETTLEPMTGKAVRVALVHADFRAEVWVDGRRILASTDEQYDADHAEMKSRMYIRTRIRETAAELDSVERRLGDVARLRRREERTYDRLSARRADLTAELEKLKAQEAHWFDVPPEVKMLGRGGGFQLRHIRLLRDVHYTSTNLEVDLDRVEISPGYQDLSRLYRYALEVVSAESDEMYDRLRHRGEYADRPNGWGVLGHPLTLRDAENDDLDEFFVLGDNSPQSHDGRSWVRAAPTLRLLDERGEPLYKLGTVPRYTLLGRAMFVYWPAGFRLPGPKSLPLVPNVGRMRFIK